MLVMRACVMTLLAPICQGWCYTRVGVTPTVPTPSQHVGSVAWSMRSQLAHSTPGHCRATAGVSCTLATAGPLLGCRARWPLLGCRARWPLPGHYWGVMHAGHCWGVAHAGHCWGVAHAGHCWGGTQEGQSAVSRPTTPPVGHAPYLPITSSRALGCGCPASAQPARVSTTNISAAQGGGGGG